MKKGLSLLAAALLICSLAGCGGISKGEYDAVCAQRDALKVELEELQNSLQELETVRVKLNGTFTAMVLAVVPGYEAGELAMVVTLYQSVPFVIGWNDEIAKEVEAGETYVFEVTDQVLEVSRAEYEKNFPCTEDLFFQYWIKLSGFREAVESDCGLDSVHLEYELCD